MPWETGQQSREGAGTPAWLRAREPCMRALGARGAWGQEERVSTYAPVCVRTEWLGLIPLGLAQRGPVADA